MADESYIDPSQRRDPESDFDLYGLVWRAVAWPSIAFRASVADSIWALERGSEASRHRLDLDALSHPRARKTGSPRAGFYLLRLAGRCAPACSAAPVPFGIGALPFLCRF